MALSDVPFKDRCKLQSGQLTRCEAVGAIRHFADSIRARLIDLLAAWKPLTGFDMKGWHDYADGSGGVAIVDVPTADVLLEALAPWSTFLTFSVKPLVPVETSTPIFEQGIAWRDSIK